MVYTAVIVVLVFITILGVASVIVGRLCSGKRVIGIGEYDFESWVERKCSTCIDGRIDVAPNHNQQQHQPSSSSDHHHIAIPAETPPEESKETTSSSSTEQIQHASTSTDHS